MKNKNTLTLCSLLFIYIVWGSTYLVIRYAIEEIPALMMSGTRFVAASGMLFAILLWRGVQWPTWRETRNASVIGVLMLAGGIGGVTFAEQWVASSIAAVVVATVPMWVAIWVGLFGKWPARIEWIGLGLGFSGVVMLNFGGELNANTLGAIVLLCSPILWALGSALSRRIALPKGALAFAIEMFAGGAFLLILSVLRGETIPSQLSSTAIAAWVYLVVFGSLLGFSAYMYLLKTVPPALATSYAYVNPLVAMALGVTIANETLSGWALLAAVAIIISVIVLTQAAKLEGMLRKRAPAQAELSCPEL